MGANAATNTYVWVIDLCGALQGASGIGGPVARAHPTSSETGTRYYAYDSNGNVIRLVDASEGPKAASYEYNSYGTESSSS